MTRAGSEDLNDWAAFRVDSYNRGNGGLAGEIVAVNGSIGAAEQRGERWSWFFDQFYAAQRSGMVFISRGKFRVWFSISINLVRGHQTVG